MWQRTNRRGESSSTWLLIERRDQNHIETSEQSHLPLPGDGYYGRQKGKKLRKPQMLLGLRHLDQPFPMCEHPYPFVH
jgi:hypothetical protein